VARRLHASIANWPPPRFVREQTDAARAYLQRALEAHPQSVRATMMLGDMESAGQDHAQAIEIWKRIEQQNPQILPLGGGAFAGRLPADRVH